MKKEGILQNVLTAGNIMFQWGIEVLKILTKISERNV